jgi:hypothetical protein
LHHLLPCRDDHYNQGIEHNIFQSEHYIRVQLESLSVPDWLRTGKHQHSQGNSCMQTPFLNRDGDQKTSEKKYVSFLQTEKFVGCFQHFSSHKIDVFSKELYMQLNKFC